MTVAPCCDARMLEGAPNFRDLGGITGADGRAVRCGQLLRSGQLNEITPADLTRLAAYPVRLVCDLRRMHERAQAPNVWAAVAGLPTLLAPEGRGSAAARPGAWVARLQDPAFDADAARAYMLKGYRSMPAAFSSVLSDLFAALDADGAPVLVHCVAGKDRTGFVCAMLLWALGASKEAIFADYLASRVYAPRRVSTALQDAAAPTPRAARALAVLATVDAAFLDAAWAEIERTHGTVDAYLHDVARVDLVRRGRLRDRFLSAPRPA
jgi:protein-tyrosine phosphatase